MKLIIIITIHESEEIEEEVRGRVIAHQIRIKRMRNHHQNHQRVQRVIQESQVIKIVFYKMKNMI